MTYSRRKFIQVSALSGAGVYMGINMIGCKSQAKSSPTNLYTLSNNLLREWGEGLLRLQAKGNNSGTGSGSIICPACGLIHGRSGDAIYPLLYLADKNNDSKYIDSALHLYQWMENNVSEPDGAWLNDPIRGAWKGITVFGSIALAEAVKNHGHVLDPKDKDRMIDRLKKAGDFIFTNFKMGYGNINYPITASYALSLLGEMLDEPGFKSKGKDLAHESLRFFTPKNKFIYGEGKPYDTLSPKGCFPVDLGYNIEESLPALVLYSLLTNDQEVMEVTVDSLKTHMEFMLPDGGWDNSWGTRNFKWTWWGSRTSDGCQPAYALLADKDLRFYKVALKNTQLLKNCTNEGLLYGGPHLYAHGISPCVHHTFCHGKALATILDHRFEHQHDVENVKLPRETVYGIKSFEDIQTWLVSKGKFRATVTGYDMEYSMKSGHATGGALSMLWHEKAGVIFAASMNKYQLVEKLNMQADKSVDSMSLTPRVEMKYNSDEYTNVSDLKAEIECRQDGETWIAETNSKLVDENQDSPSIGDVFCAVKYMFSDEKIILKYQCDYQIEDAPIRILLPVISVHTETFTLFSDRVIFIEKGNCTLKISADQPIEQLPMSGKRIFNFVPGMEAIPLVINNRRAEIIIEVV